MAMALAERHGLTIVSADSRQIYRRFDLGTAKPSADERARVVHCGIDIADPEERWSAARWATDAAQWIGEAGIDRTLVVGGTGLYLKALTAPFFVEPQLDPARRQALGVELASLPVPELRLWVQRLDPPRAHLGRAQLLRAAEVALLTGERLSDLHHRNARPAAFRGRWLVVDPGEGLQAQIAARIDGMFKAGWLEEARALSGDVHSSAPAWQACGYSVVRDAALGRVELGVARAAILVETRQYAKRQRTWFRHQLAGADVTRLDPHTANAADVAEAWWNSEEVT